MLHRIDNTTSSLRRRSRSFGGCFREWPQEAKMIWPNYIAAPERRCTVWPCPISATPTTPRT